MRILLLFFMLTSCARTYILNGSVHHLIVPEKIVIKSDIIQSITIQGDSLKLVKQIDFNQIEFIENKRVLKYNGIYYIRSNSKHKFPENVNRCINF